MQECVGVGLDVLCGGAGRRVLCDRTYDVAPVERRGVFGEPERARQVVVHHLNVVLTELERRSAVEDRVELRMVEAAACLLPPPSEQGGGVDVEFRAAGVERRLSRGRRRRLAEDLESFFDLGSPRREHAQ